MQQSTSVALIDGDLLCYRNAAYTTEEEGFDKCKERIDFLANKILDESECEQYRMFLTGKTNFRKVINPKYKANRDAVPRPVFLKQAQEYLVSQWEAEFSPEYLEADDMMGITQNVNTIICSLDKDLRQIPGRLFSWEIMGTASSGKQWSRPAQFYDVTHFDGLKLLYKQCLVGDTADNIIGVHKVGPVKADKYIDPCETEQEMFDQCLELYQNDYKRLINNLCCLWIMRYHREFFTTNLDLVLTEEQKLYCDELEKLQQETVYGKDA